MAPGPAPGPDPDLNEDLKLGLEEREREREREREGGGEREGGREGEEGQEALLRVGGPRSATLPKPATKRFIYAVLTAAGVPLPTLPPHPSFRRISPRLVRLLQRRTVPLSHTWRDLFRSSVILFLSLSLSLLHAARRKSQGVTRAA
jgi:hypothetical protein